MNMFRLIYYTVVGERKVILRKGEWKGDLEHCFSERQPSTSTAVCFRRVEVKSGTVQYYYQLIDSEGRTVIRSVNFIEAEHCHREVEDESQRSNLSYDIQAIFVPFVLYSVAQ